MAKEKNTKNKSEEKMKQETQEKIESKNSKRCNDIKCPFNGNLSLRGRVFRGIVVKKFPRRVVIEFERTIFVQKYERYAKSRTKLHARLPICLENNVNIGDYVEIRECRPLSKIIAFVVVKKLRSKEEMENKKSSLGKTSEKNDKLEKINSGGEKWKQYQQE